MGRVVCRVCDEKQACRNEAVGLLNKKSRSWVRLFILSWFDFTRVDLI